MENERTNPWETPPAKGCLVDSETGEEMEFQYNPSEVLDEKSAHFAAVRIPGMSHPRYQFVSGEPRKIAFRLRFFKGDAREKVAWLQSLLYPEHSGTMLKNAPHRVVFVFGDLFPGLLCVVREAKVRYHGLFEPETLLPQQADVDVVLEECAEESVPYSEVRG